MCDVMCSTCSAIQYGRATLLQSHVLVSKAHTVSAHDDTKCIGIEALSALHDRINALYL